jgi:hypothetical protein
MGLIQWLPLSEEYFHFFPQSCASRSTLRFQSLSTAAAAAAASVNGKSSVSVVPRKSDEVKLNTSLLGTYFTGLKSPLATLLILMEVTQAAFSFVRPYKQRYYTHAKFKVTSVKVSTDLSSSFGH